MRPLPAGCRTSTAGRSYGSRRSRSCGWIATTTRSTRGSWAVASSSASPSRVTAVVLDTGELACRHRRVFAGGLTITDPAHQTELERQRARRRQRHEVEVEIRPLSRYDAADPGMTKAASELAHLFRALKAPGGRAGAARARRPRPRGAVEL